MLLSLGRSCRVISKRLKKGYNYSYTHTLDQMEAQPLKPTQRTPLARLMYGLLSVGSLSFLLAGCTSKPDLRPSGLLSLTQAPLALKVNRIDTVVQYLPAEEGTNVDPDMIPPPSVILTQWIHEHFKARGGEGRAVITIEDASITESPLKTQSQNPFASAMVRYAGNLAVKLEILDGAGNSRGYARATASAGLTVPESLSIDERQQVWVTLTEEMINKLNNEIERNTKEYLGDHLS